MGTILLISVFLVCLFLILAFNCGVHRNDHTELPTPLPFSEPYDDTVIF